LPVTAAILLRFSTIEDLNHFRVLKDVFEISYDKVTIADLNPSENRPIVLWGMSYFKYPERN